MYYIQEADKLSFFMKIFNIIKLQEDKIILPILKDEEISTKKAIKLAEKTRKILKKTMCKKIVISKNIKKQEEYINLLYSYNLEIPNGRWLFEALACKALEYILEQKNIKKEETIISILVNDLSENMLENIRKIAREYKQVNITTNHIEKFKKIEKQIFEEEGIMITVGNNKRKGISKAKIILNVDFPSELINEFNIFEDAIIINIRKNVKIEKKRFNGIAINDYEITFKSRENGENDKPEVRYKLCEIYEAEFNKRQSFNDIVANIEKDGVEIVILIGKNGEIK